MKVSVYLSSILLVFNGYLHAQEKPVFERPVRIEAAGNAIELDLGYTYPTIVDLDNDGLNDLVIGKMDDGGVDFHQNIGDKDTPQYAAAIPLMVDGKPMAVHGVGL